MKHANRVKLFAALLAVVVVVLLGDVESVDFTRSCMKGPKRSGCKWSIVLSSNPFICWMCLFVENSVGDEINPADTTLCIEECVELKLIYHTNIYV